MSRIRKQPVASYNPWDWEREAGDRVYAYDPSHQAAYMIDLVESRGRNKRDAGELTPRIVKKNGKVRLAYRAGDGIWYWDTQEN